MLGSRFSSPILAYILGGLLVFAGFMGLTGFSKKMRFGKKIAWLGGALSGLLGGLVGTRAASVLRPCSASILKPKLRGHGNGHRSNRGWRAHANLFLYQPKPCIGLGFSSRL